MGRRQYLTVRKRRCNERQALKKKKEEKLLKKTQRVYGKQDSILPGDYVVSESSGIQNCEDDSQFGTEHEIDDKCDTKLEMTESKEQDDEVSSCHEVVAKSSLVDHFSFDDTIDDSIDANSLDV